jgi:hypothetical protein
MIMKSDEHVTELRMNAADLYREETFTDRKVGTIRRLTPVTIDGSPDNGRQVIYVGQAQLLTPVGAVPLTFEISARSFAEAIEKFSDAAKVAVDHTVEELQELRREAASSIVLPETGAGGLGVPGGFPGGGKIKLP